MSGFGGSVKLTGANEYKNALAQITQSLKVVSAEMKATSSAFANNDMSQKEVEASAKKLKASLEQQKSALASLKGQLAQMTAEYEKTGQKHEQLIKEYDKEKFLLLFNRKHMRDLEENKFDILDRIREIRVGDPFSSGRRRIACGR